MMSTPSHDDFSGSQEHLEDRQWFMDQSGSEWSDEEEEEADKKKYYNLVEPNSMMAILLADAEPLPDGTQMIRYEGMFDSDGLLNGDVQHLIRDLCPLSGGNMRFCDDLEPHAPPHRVYLVVRTRTVPAAWIPCFEVKIIAAIPVQGDSTPLEEWIRLQAARQRMAAFAVAISRLDRPLNCPGVVLDVVGNATKVVRHLPPRPRCGVIMGEIFFSDCPVEECLRPKLVKDILGFLRKAHPCPIWIQWLPTGHMDQYVAAGCCTASDLAEELFLENGSAVTDPAGVPPNMKEQLSDHVINGLIEHACTSEQYTDTALLNYRFSPGQ